MGVGQRQIYGGAIAPLDTVWGRHFERLRRSNAAPKLSLGGGAIAPIAPLP